MSVDEDEGFEQDGLIEDDNLVMTRMQLRRSLQALDALSEAEDEEDEDSVAIDGEGEIVYDHNAAKPDYKLFSLRSGSCLNYHQLIQHKAEESKD
jgi:hypothetical protein